jgi:hypothetical protein
MGWFILGKVLSPLWSIVYLGRLSCAEKDLEILLLRQQIDILHRKHNRPIRASRVEKTVLAVLTTKLKQVSRRSARQLSNVIHIFQPETVLRWHRDIDAVQARVSTGA